MNRLQGKVALITGAAQGIGQATAARFVSEGARVILTDVKEEAGLVLAATLGLQAIFLRHDVTQSAEWDNVVRAGEAAFGPISVLVNNAGILGPIAKTDEMDEADFLRVCSVNQTSVFLGMKAVLPSMLRSGVGSIVNISSLAGIRAVAGNPGPAYVGSKFAVRGMTKAVAAQYGPNNIRVNSIHPGYIWTPMLEEAQVELHEARLQTVPLRRVGQASDVAHLALFLASDESGYITGAEHVIDGGIAAQ
jgi:3alpha(or 20beta)-hydroxysteroid dehydrogenase